MPALTQLRLSQLSLDPLCQARVRFSEEHAEKLADVRRRDVAYRDPLVVFRDVARYWLADGFHRRRGEELANGPRAWVNCDVRHGTLRDARLFAASANQLEMLGRSHEDKRRAVLMLLLDEEWAAWEGRRIARHCGVSEGLVRLLRGELAEEEPAYDTQPEGTVERIGRLAGRRAPRPSPADRAATLARIAVLARTLRQLTSGLGEEAGAALGHLDAFVGTLPAE